MICPFYKNKQVFDGFNEIIEAFGGRPMTEEEFRDPELRKMRSGRDHSAMEAAYITYNRNGGNFLTETPQGKPSLLFQTLLDYFGGDRKKAIVAKSNVYSDEFAEWFGDWWGPLNVEESKDIKYGPISKVVDANGEPLVVWHHTNNPKLDKFRLDFKNYFQNNGGTNKAFFFDENTHGTLNRKYDLPVYLNIRDLNEYTGTKEQLHQSGTSYREVVNNSAERNDVDGGVHMKDFDDNKMEHQSIWIAHAPNQIKHVKNLGTWNPNDANMYHLMKDDFINEDVEYFKTTSIVSHFGQDLAQRLENGETVSSRSLMLHMLSSGVIHSVDNRLAKVLAQHDIPVRVGYDMMEGEFAKILQKDGGSVIFINPNELSRVSSGYATTTLMHEIIHALTVDIMNNPITQEDRAFVDATKHVFRAIRKNFKNIEVHQKNVVDGMYALSSEKEFIACFASDPHVREQILDLAEKLDRINNTNKFTNYIKKLINRIVKAFSKKAIFNTNSLSDEIKEYEDVLTKFLYNQPIIEKGNIPSKSKLHKIYDAVDKKTAAYEDFIEDMKSLERMKEAEKNYLIGISKTKVKDLKSGGTQIASFEDVIGALKTRIDALKTSMLDDVQKGRLISQTETQMKMFIIDEGGKYAAIQNLLKTSVPQLIETVDRLRQIRREGGTFTNVDYMREMHANVGMYNQAFEKILSIIDADYNVDELISKYNALYPEEHLTIEDIKTLKQDLENAKSFSSTAMRVLGYMLKDNGAATLKKIADEVGNPDMDKYIQSLMSEDSSLIVDDISQYEMLAGAADASANEAVRALTYIINKALNKAHYGAIDKQTDLLQLQKNLKRGEKGWHLYEKDEFGNFTGYLVRDLNFGKFYRNYRKEIEDINTKLNKYFGLNVELSRSVAPDGEDGKRLAVLKVTINGEEVEKEISAKEYFELRKEQWLNKNAERKYKPQYYEFYSQLPQRVKEQLGAIRIEEDAIKQNYPNLYDENNVPHYEQLSDEDWIKINVLWERKRFLHEYTDEYGHQKEGIALEDAKALRKLYKDLYHIDFDATDEEARKNIASKKYKKEAWLTARNKIIERYGEGSKELEKWDERNSRRTLKTNEDGEALVFLEIEKEFGDQRVQYEDGYEDLKKARKDILRNFKMLNGEYDANRIPQALKNLILELELKMYNSRVAQKNRNSALSESATRYAEIFDKYIKYVDSLQLKRAKEWAHEEALKRVAEEDDDLGDSYSVEEWEAIILSDAFYGELRTDDDLLADVEFKPYSWLTRIEAVDEKFMTTEPNDAWIEREETDLINPNFDESYGVTWVPKRELYDNSAQYEKIFGKKMPDGTRSGGSETLAALYKGIQDTIKESNELYERTYADNFMLPQVECTSLERLARRSTYRKWWDFWRKLFGFGRILGMNDDPNDTETHRESVENSDTSIDYNIIGKYPDGRDFHSMPKYYTKRLDHPELISKDIVKITASYYYEARKFKERSLIKDDCELIVDLLEQQKFTTYTGKVNKWLLFGKKEVTGGKQAMRLTGQQYGESNTYKYAKQIVERDLYDIQRSSIQFLGLDVSKVFGLWKRWTSARNLGLNPKVAAVGFFTSQFAHIINALTGYKYSAADAFKASMITFSEFGLNAITGQLLGNRLTKNKLMLLLENLDISGMFDRKAEHSNRNRWLQVLYKNSTFGFLTCADLYSKAMIAVATLLSYRLVDNKFMTKQMIEESRLRVGEAEYKRLMKEYKKSKVNAYNIFEGDRRSWKGKFSSGETSLVIKEEYKAAWEEIRHAASNKAIKNAEAADGMATRMQKAMITRNAIGALILIHRQYIPLMIQQTLGKTVYDYDTQEYKNGQFRIMFEYLIRLCGSNALAAAGGAAFVGVAFGGFGLIPLIAAPTAFVASLTHKIFSKQKRKSLKEVNKEFFDNSFFNIIRPGRIKQDDAIQSKDESEYALKVYRQYQLRQTLLEVALLNCFVAPVANFMCALADNTKKDDDWWKWLLIQTLAYWARAAQFETNAKYNVIDLLNNIRSATAATATSDSVVDLLDNISSLTAVGSRNKHAEAGLIKLMYDFFVDFIKDNKNEEEIRTFLKNEENMPDDIVKRGVYQGESKLWKAIQKMHGWHNIKEQTIDPATKRRYTENQIMRMSKDDKYSVLFDLIVGYEN